MESVQVHPEVEQALLDARPVVALESAALTTGLPRSPLPSHLQFEYSNWNRESPLNLEAARLMEHAVREEGATPATIAVIDGNLKIGLADDDLNFLTDDLQIGKAGSSQLGWMIGTNQSAGLTVSGTLAACRALAEQTHDQQRIHVMSTGGIGGVHKSWQALPDISADLSLLASTPMCVVCSGAKAILDLPATLEMLESMSVPVIGYRTRNFPKFLSAGDKSLQLVQCVDDAHTAARTCGSHWGILKSKTGVVIANPPPAEFALDPVILDSAIDAAETEAQAQMMSGPKRTPFLLAELSRVTNGKSLIANLAVLINNARLAGSIATAMANKSMDK